MTDSDGTEPDVARRERKKSVDGTTIVYGEGREQLVPDDWPSLFALMSLCLRRICYIDENATREEVLTAWSHVQAAKDEAAEAVARFTKELGYLDEWFIAEYERTGEPVRLEIGDGRFIRRNLIKGDWKPKFGAEEMLELLLAKFGGDIGLLAKCLSAQAWKAGAIADELVELEDGRFIVEAKSQADAKKRKKARRGDIQRSFFSQETKMQPEVAGKKKPLRRPEVVDPRFTGR